MQTSFRLYTLFLLFIVHSSLSFSDGQLTAAVFNHAPISYYNQADELTGVMPDFIQLLSKEMGIPISIHRMPYGRMLQSLASGESDFAIFYYSEATDTIVDSLIKLLDARVIVIGLKKVNIQQYDELKTLTIATPRNFFYDPRFDNDAELNKFQTTNYEMAIRLLFSGRVDAIAGSLEAVHYQMKLLDLDTELLGKPFELNKNEIWLRFSKKSSNAHLKPALILATEKLQQQQHFTRLFDFHNNLSPPIEGAP